MCFTQLAIDLRSFTETCPRQEGRLQRHSGRPVSGRESADISGFLAQRKPEIHFGK